jgi:hypothetical protein
VEILRNQALAGLTNSNSVAATFAKSGAPSVTNVFQLCPGYVFKLCPGFIKASMVLISPKTVSNSSTYLAQFCLSARRARYGDRYPWNSSCAPCHVTHSKEADMTDKQTDTNYAGRSQEERRAQRKGEKQRAQEQPGGDMAQEGTEPDKNHSSGQLSDKGKKIWQTGSGIDGGGKT